MNKSVLKLDWASHKSAKFAVENWHYSKTMPAGKLVKVGVWENGQFIGVVLFGCGAGNSTNGLKYGLRAVAEMAELVRVALRPHETPVSRIISIAVKMLVQNNPKLRLLISFADRMEQGHHGGIYQAGNWIYVGDFTGCGGYLIKGKRLHSKSVHSRGWLQSVEWLKNNIDPKAKKLKTIKHRYLMPLDAKMRARIAPLAKPYPKRVK